jgi:hydroxymethylbilane synthase
VRGNVPTRVAKALDPPTGSPNQGEILDAVVLAAAGLRRLSLTAHIAEVFDVDRFVPAVGQGILGLEHRRDDSDTAQLLAPLGDRETATAAAAERGLLRRLGAGCTVPLGAHARLTRSRVSLIALVGNPENGEAFRFQGEADERAAAELGATVAEEMLQSPASRFLTEPPPPGTGLAGFSS